MREINLPLIPDSAINIGSCFSVFFEKEYVTWCHGMDIINRHRRNDQNEYRLEIARLCAQGSVKQSDMARATGLHRNTIMSYVSRLLSRGCSSFYADSPVRGGAVLTAEKLQEYQELLDQGKSRSETARIAGIKKNTLDKAIRDGRLRQPRAQHWQGSQPADRKSASLAAAPLMGMGCTAIVERMAASVGKLAGVPSQFEPARTVEDGGVLCAELGRMELDIMDVKTKHAEEKLQEKARTLEDIKNLQAEVDELKKKLKDIPKRLPYEKLPKNEKFKGLEPTRKLLLDTIRMVAYRAETAMASMADDFLSAPDTVRSWMKALMKSPADIVPDYSTNTINVTVYPLGEERMNHMLRQLIQTLNETMTVFPGTDMVLNYSLLT